MNRWGLKCLAIVVVVLGPRVPAIAQELERRTNALSLDSLLNVKISTASRTLQTVSEAPASVTIISAEDIARYGYRTLDEALTTVKGFYRSYDRNYVYVGVRGFSRPTDYNDRLLLLLDGHVMNDNFYGSAPAGTDFPLDFGSIERIEIVRGPGSALYGTGAMFAVINIITKRGASIDGVDISAETGSYGRLKGAILAGKEWANGVDASFSASWVDVKGHDIYYRDYDNPGTNHGIAHNLDWDRYYSTLGTIRYRGISLTGYYGSRTKGISTGAFGTLFNDSRAHTLDRDAYLELKYDEDIGSDKNIVLKTSFFSYAYRGEYPYSVDSYDMNDAQLFEVDAQFRWDLSPGNRLIAGVELRHNTVASYRYWDLNTVYFDANFPYDVFSVYLQDEFQVLDNLLITLGFRQDKDVNSESSTTPRGAIVYKPFESTTWKLLYGEGFRSPNLYEAHYADPVSGFKSNPGLRAENIRTMETVLEQRIGALSFGSCSLYRYWMSDLIDTMTDPADSVNHFQNISTVRAYGIELNFETRWRSGATGYANYTFQNAEDPATGEQLSNVPRHLARLGCSYPLFSHFDIALEIQYETSRKTVYNTMTDPFLVANTSIVVRHFLGGLTGSLSIRNLFDASYGNPGGFEHKQPIIPQDGRNMLVAISYSF